MNVPVRWNTVRVMTNGQNNDDDKNTPSVDKGDQNNPQPENMAGQMSPVRKRKIKKGAIVIGALALAAGAWLLIHRNAPSMDSGSIGTVTDDIEEIQSAGKEILVSSHLRTLPDGWHASPQKIMEAYEKGIDIPQGKTLVDSYTRMA